MSKRAMYAKKSATRRLYLQYFLARCQGLKLQAIANRFGHSHSRVENALYVLRRLYGATTDLQLLVMLISDGVFVIDDETLKLDYEL